MLNRKVDRSRTAPSGTGARKSPASKQQPYKNGGKPSRSIVNQRQTPWVLIASIAAVVVFAAVVVVIAVTHHSSSERGTTATGQQIIPSTPVGRVTVQQRPKRVPNATGIRGVLAWDTEGWPGDGASHPGALQHDHVPGPVTYAVLPPVGGPHSAVWMNAGVYTQPVPSERAVHNLEHGAVWITYDPNVPKSQVSALTAFVTKQSLIPESNGGMSAGQTGQANRYVDLSPWPSNNLPAPIVISSWGYQLRVNSPSDPRLQQFVDTFRNSSKYSPEFGSAVDGIPLQTGGRPADDGSSKPNPSG